MIPRRGLCRSDRPGPAARALPAIHQLTEQRGGLLGVIQGRMGLSAVEGDLCADAGLGQHRLAENQSTEGRGIKGGERMERVTLQPGAAAAIRKEWSKWALWATTTARLHA